MWRNSPVNFSVFAAPKQKVRWQKSNFCWRRWRAKKCKAKSRLCSARRGHGKLQLFQDDAAAANEKVHVATYNSAARCGVRRWENTLYTSAQVKRCRCARRLEKTTEDSRSLPWRKRKYGRVCRGSAVAISHLSLSFAISLSPLATFTTPAKCNSATTGQKTEEEEKQTRGERAQPWNHKNKNQNPQPISAGSNHKSPRF